MFSEAARRLKPRAKACEVGLRRLQSTQVDLAMVARDFSRRVPYLGTYPFWYAENQLGVFQMSWARSGDRPQRAKKSALAGLLTVPVMCSQLK